MTRSQKYEVSNANDSLEYQLTATNPNQAKDMEYSLTTSSSEKPALTITDVVPKRKVYGPWIAMMIVGVCVACFLGFMYGSPNSPAIMKRHKKPHRRNLTVQGNLVSYPHIPDFNPDDRFPNEYFIGLDSKYFRDNYESMLSLTSKYPHQNSSEGLPDPYVHCWLERPSSGKPCFFDKGWMGSQCTNATHFGYHHPEREGYINPCFAVRIENSGFWKPHNWQADELKDSTNFDPSFVGLDCQPLDYRYNHIKIKQSPTKGYPLPFFPMNHFHEDKYLIPAVMVRVYGIGPKENVTVECRLTTPDSYHLTDSGKIRVTFFHSLKLVEDIDPRVNNASEDIQEESSTKQSTLWSSKVATNVVIGSDSISQRLASTTLPTVEYDTDDNYDYTDEPELSPN